MTTREPRTRHTIGRDDALITRLTRTLSDRTLDRVNATNLPPLPKEATRAYSC
jgi:hypothetical protein